MNIKEKIIIEIETLPDSTLLKVLNHIQNLKEEISKEDDVWQCYIDSKKERKEVYHRLANS